MVNLERQCSHLTGEVDKLKKEKVSVQKAALHHRDVFSKKEQQLKKAEKEVRSHLPACAMMIISCHFISSSVHALPSTLMHVSLFPCTCLTLPMHLLLLPPPLPPLPPPHFPLNTQLATIEADRLAAFSALSTLRDHANERHSLQKQNADLAGQVQQMGKELEESRAEAARWTSEAQVRSQPPQILKF